MYNKIKLLSYWYEMKTAKIHNPNQSDALQTRQKEVENNGMKLSLIVIIKEISKPSPAVILSTTLSQERSKRALTFTVFERLEKVSHD